MATNHSRLLILGLLSLGPMHGHLIRRVAEVTNVQEWAEIRVGSLYGMLHRLEGEGLIEAVRSEQAGNRPVRTVYAITPMGRMELHSLREHALQDVSLRSAPVDLALLFAPGGEEGDLRSMLEVRRKRIAAMLEELVEHHRRDESSGVLPPSGPMIFRHHELRLEAELRWHDELAEHVAAIAAAPAFTPPAVDGVNVVELPHDRRTA